MSLVFVREVWSGRTGSAALSSFENNYVRKFEVKYSTTLESSVVVLTTPGIPRRGEIYAPAIAAGEFDINARCVKVTATQRQDDWQYWDVQADYSNKFDTDIAQIAANPELLENPLLRPAKINFSFADYQLPVFRDLRGVPTVNSAKQRFENPLTLEAGRVVINYERNEGAYNIGVAALYNKAVNSDVFLGLLPGRAKVHSISASQQWEGPYAYWSVAKEIHFQGESFNDYLLDWGPEYYDGGYPDGKRKTFRDIHNHVLSSGGGLNGKGDQQSASASSLDAAMDETTTQAVFPGASFPAVDLDLREWAIKVDDEIMAVTSDEGDHYEVIRGYAGTTPAAHAAGADVSLEPVLLVFQLHRRLPFNILDILI